MGLEGRSNGTDSLSADETRLWKRRDRMVGKESAKGKLGQSNPPEDVGRKHFKQLSVPSLGLCIIAGDSLPLVLLAGMVLLPLPSFHISYQLHSACSVGSGQRSESVSFPRSLSSCSDLSSPWRFSFLPSCLLAI